MDKVHPLPDEVHCIVTCDNRGVARLFVKIRFRTAQKNDYTVLAWPTDGQGSVMLTKEAVLASANTDLHLAGMDFRRITDVSTGEVHVQVMGEKGLRAAVAACELFGERWYPAGYRDALEQALQVAGDLDVRKCRLQVTVIPPCCEVFIQRQASESSEGS